MTEYIPAVRSAKSLAESPLESPAKSPDLAKLWAEYVIEPYWNEWAAGQFNEERIRSEMSEPITDMDRLEEAVNVLSSSNMEETLLRAYEKISQMLPPPEADKVVCVYANTRIDEGVHGIVGTCTGDSILIQVNPLVPGWEAYVQWVLAHEHNHTVWGYNYYYLKHNGSQDLLTAIITEGEADSFAKAICPGVHPRWIRALSAVQEREQWAAMKEYLFCEDNMELHRRFFFGCEKTATPANTGYTIGFNIVQAYLKAMPGVSFPELAGKDAKEIFEFSDYDNDGCPKV